MNKTFQKIETIQNQIEELKSKKETLEQAFSTQLLNVLKKKSALHLEFDTLIGGLLHVIEAIKIKDPMSEKWKHNGENFRKGRSKINETISEDPAKN